MTVIFIQGRFTKLLQKFCQERIFFVNQIIPPCKIKLLGKLLHVYKFTPLKNFTFDLRRLKSSLLELIPKVVLAIVLLELTFISQCDAPYFGHRTNSLGWYSQDDAQLFQL